MVEQDLFGRSNCVLMAKARKLILNIKIANEANLKLKTSKCYFHSYLVMQIRFKRCRITNTSNKLIKAPQEKKKNAFDSVELRVIKFSSGFLD